MIQWFQRFGLSLRFAAALIVALLVWLMMRLLDPSWGSSGLILIILSLNLTLIWLLVDQLMTRRRRLDRALRSSFDLAEINHYSPSRMPCLLGLLRVQVPRERFLRQMDRWKGQSGRGSESENRFIFQTGRWFYFFRVGLFFSLIMFLTGLGLSSSFREDRRFRLLEGQSSGSMLPFRLDFARVDDQDPEALWLLWGHGKDSSQTLRLQKGQSKKLGSQEIFVTSLEKTESLGVTLLAEKDGEELQSRLPPRGVGGVLSLDGAEVQILKIDLNDAESGPAVQLRYQDEKRKEPIEFWIFERFKTADREKKENRIFSFEIEKIRPISWVEVRAVYDPGLMWIWWGTLLGLVFLIGALFFHHRVLWVFWEQEEIAVVGWSEDLSTFYPDFLKNMIEIGKTLGVPSDLYPRLEVWRGSL